MKPWQLKNTIVFHKYKYVYNFLHPRVIGPKQILTSIVFFDFSNQTELELSAGLPQNFDEVVGNYIICGKYTPTLKCV